MQRDFHGMREQGRSVEKIVAAWFVRHGYAILPVYDYSGLADDKAPRLATAQASDPRGLVTPDLLVAARGKTKWVEVKFKTQANWTRITQRYETGFALRLFNDYLEVEHITGLPVHIVFAHRCENEVRGQTLEILNLRKRVFRGDTMDRGGTVFFDWESLSVYGRLSDIEAEQLSNVRDANECNAELPPP